MKTKELLLVVIFSFTLFSVFTQFHNIPHHQPAVVEVIFPSHSPTPLPLQEETLYETDELLTTEGELAGRLDKATERYDHGYRIPVVPKSTDYKCRAFFSINSGRSGSSLLYKAISWLTDKGRETVTFHEHKHFHVENNGIVYREGLEVSYELRKERRLPSIIAALDEGNMYAESSHFFIKSWHDVAMDYLLERGCRVDVINLRRHLPKVVGSLWRNFFELECKRYWYYRAPNMITRLKKPVTIELDEILSGAIYYALDIEEQSNWFKKEYGNHPLVHVHDIDLELIGTPKGILSLAEILEATYRETFMTRYKAVACTIANPKIKSHGPNQDTEVMEAIQLYLQKAKEQGIYTPPLPQMYEKVYLPECKEGDNELPNKLTL